MTEKRVTLDPPNLASSSGLLQAIEGAAGRRLEDFSRAELERLVKGFAQVICDFNSLLHRSLHQYGELLTLFAEALYELKKPRGRPKKRGPLTALLHFFPDALPPKQAGRPKKYTAEQYEGLISIVDRAKELRGEEGCYDLSDKATLEALLLRRTPPCELKKKVQRYQKLLSKARVRKRRTVAKSPQK